MSNDERALRNELWRQWHSNHYEHCGNMDNHIINPEGTTCFWPVPDVLKKALSDEALSDQLDEAMDGRQVRP